MPSEKAPKSFDKEIYEETLSLIKENKKSFKSDAEKELARLIGGKEFEAAVDTKACPPCTNDYDCGKCWVNEQCVHESKTIKQRKKEITKLKAKEAKNEPKQEPKEEETSSIDTDAINKGMEDLL